MEPAQFRGTDVQRSTETEKENYFRTTTPQWLPISASIIRKDFVNLVNSAVTDMKKKSVANLIVIKLIVKKDTLNLVDSS